MNEIRQEHLRQLIKLGLTSTEIARYLQVSQKRIYNRAALLGWTFQTCRPACRYTLIQRRKWLALKGYTEQEIERMRPFSDLPNPKRPKSKMTCNRRPDNTVCGTYTVLKGDRKKRVIYEALADAMEYVRPLNPWLYCRW